MSDPALPLSITTIKGRYQCLLSVSFSTSQYSRVGERIILTYKVVNTGERKLSGNITICNSLGQRETYALKLDVACKQIFTTLYTISGSDLLTPNLVVVSNAILEIKNCMKLRSNCLENLLTNVGESFTGFTGSTGPTGPSSSQGSLESFMANGITGTSMSTGGYYAILDGGTNPSGFYFNLIPVSGVTGTTGMPVESIGSPGFIALLRTGIYQMSYNITVQVNNAQNLLAIRSALLIITLAPPTVFRIISNSYAQVCPTSGTTGTAICNLASTFIEELPAPGYTSAPFIVALLAEFITSSDPEPFQVVVPMPRTYDIGYPLQSFSTNVVSLSGILLQATDIPV